MGKLTREDYKRIKKVKGYQLPNKEDTNKTGLRLSWGEATVEGLIVVGIMVVLGIIGYLLS